MKRIFLLFLALLILLPQLPIVSQTASAAPSAPYVVNFSNSNNLTASSDSTVVPGSTGVASQKFVLSGSGWNGAFYTDWGTHDVSSYNTLEFWVKGEAGDEALSINVSDGTNNYSANIQTPSDGSWEHVSIDLSDMTVVDFTKWNTITFTCNTSTENTTFYINNVQFTYIDPYTGPQVTVVPWNGAQSAVSLTFDDGYDSQLDYAVPALDAKGMKGTFYVTETAITGSRKDDWKNLPLVGHEIGNHSKHHYEPSANPTQPYQRTFDDTLGYDETVAAQAMIEQALDTTVVTYAYPYTNNDPYLVKYLKDTHISARGGWGDGTHYMKSSHIPDWMNISSQFTWSGGSFNTDYKSWIDNAISQSAWTVFGIHEVGGADLPLDQFNLLVDYLDTNRSSIWIAPFGTVSGYWRAQKTIENLTPNATSTGTSYTWDVPAYFPNNINLKVKLKNGDGYQLVQNGQAIQSDADGNYTISFGAKSLELTNEPQSDIVPVETQAYDWGRVKIVGGGLITGIIFNPTEKDLIYARTDMGGAYRWDPATKTWIQLLEWVSMEDWNLSGVESIATDPIDPNRVYIAAGSYSNEWTDMNGYILRSEDRGQTWEKTEMPFKFGGNMYGRTMGERLAVDPNDNRILYLGVRNGNGLWKSEDYGATWHKVSSFTPIGDVNESISNGNIGPVWVTFDPSTGSAGHATQTIYVGLADTQTSIYKSVDGGATWEPVAGQPNQGFLPHHGTLGSNGMLYVTYNSGVGPWDGGTGAVWKLNTKTDEWTDISPGGAGTTEHPYGGLAVDAQHPDTLMVSTLNKWWPDNQFYRSTDGGQTWKPFWEFTAYPQRDNRYTIDYSISPWLDWGIQRDPLTDPETSPKLGWGIGDLEIDPFNSDRIMYGTGATLYGSEDMTNFDKGEKIKISVMADGIEENGIIGLISPPSGAPLISAMGDLGGFRHEDINKSPHAITNPNFGTSTDLDFAETNPNLIVRVGHPVSFRPEDPRIAISTDNGITWTPGTNAWQAEPGDTTDGGTVAVGANGQTILWAPNPNVWPPNPNVVRPVSFSTDLGKTWTASKGIPQGASVSSDRVNPNKFYGFLEGKFYVSTDGGANFTASAATGLPYNVSGKFKAVPTAEGDIWLAGSADDEHPEYGAGLFRSTDSGASFNKLSGVDAALSVGFGKEAPGKTYKTIYAVMKVNGSKSGIYRSEDEGASWLRINDDQHQFANVDKTITGDGQVYGRVYIGTNGMGIVRGDIKQGTTVQPTMQSYVNEMQPGYNLGNSLDARGSDETSWGNPVVTQAFIQQIAAQGFKSIRIPVTWYQHTGPAPSYTVDPEWMSRVQQIVDWSLEAGLYVMINMHHDSVEWVHTMDTNHDQVVAEYTAVWTQIADTFKNYSDKLMFESINEPVFGNNLDTTTQMSLLHELNAIFFNLVRASGGNNGDRPLVLPTLWTNDSQEYVDSLAATIETLNDSNIIATVHYYGMWPFSVNIAGYTTFNDEVKNSIDTMVNNVYNTFVSNGIPVVVGEYGILGYGKGEETVERGEMLKYFEHFLHATQSKSIATMFWDYGPYVNRNSFEWSDPELYNIIMHSLTGRTSTTSFDRIFIKSGETVSDQSVTLNLNGNSFVSLKNGDQTLVSGTDYTVDGNVLTLKASYLSGFATGEFGQKAVLSAQFSAGPAWKLHVNYYDTATLFSASGTITTQGFDIPTAFNGDRIATMEAKYAEGGNAGPHNWTSYKEIYAAYSPDYANESIRLTSAFFQNTNDGVVNLTFHFWSGKVVTYTITKDGTSITGIGTGTSEPIVSITSYEDGQAINLNSPQIDWLFHDDDASDVQAAYQVQASSNGWETVDMDSDELEGATNSYTLDGLADGKWSIRVRLKDNGGAWSEWAYRSLIIDTTVPTLNVVLDKETLWPANNKLVKVTATVETDVELSQVELLSITPSVAVDRYESMVQEADFGTFDTEFLLLAKKAKGKEPLVYTITYRAIDQAGNVTEASVTVTVPHDQSEKK